MPGRACCWLPLASGLPLTTRPLATATPHAQEGDDEDELAHNGSHLGVTRGWEQKWWKHDRREACDEALGRMITKWEGDETKDEEAKQRLQNMVDHVVACHCELERLQKMTAIGMSGSGPGDVKPPRRKGIDWPCRLPAERGRIHCRAC